jgi:hypothetical protein
MEMRETAIVGEHTKEWEAYKSLKRKFFLMWLFYLPVCFAAVLVSTLIFGKGSYASILVLAVLALIWISRFGSLGDRLRAWKCPRCNAAFESWWRLSTSHCASCELQKYS